MCSHAGCDKPILTKRSGLCDMHYTRVRRHGDPNVRERKANGEGNVTIDGYARLTQGDRRIREHVLVAERVLGRPLPEGAVVHHVNESRLDNRPCNLVMCEDQGYHNIIHARLNALRATGDVHKRPCRFCRQYDSVSAMMPNGTNFYHKACNAEYQRDRRAKHRR